MEMSCLDLRRGLRLWRYDAHALFKRAPRIAMCTRRNVSRHGLRWFLGLFIGLGKCLLKTVPSIADSIVSWETARGLLVIGRELDYDCFLIGTPPLCAGVSLGQHHPAL